VNLLFPTKDQKLISTSISRLLTNFFESLLDKYLTDQRATYHVTYMNQKMKFHDPNASNPDWKVKQGYLLMIAAATEVETGIENLWKSGPSGGRSSYPDFGQYMHMNDFKCFISAAPYCWANESFWYEEKRDIPWEIFLPCLDRSSKSISISYVSSHLNSVYA